MTERLTDEALANIAALLRDDQYLCQCDGLASLLKTAHQAADALDELLAYRRAGVAVLDDTSLRSCIGELGNQIHNLGCEHQGNEALAERLQELRSVAWDLARRAPATPPPASRADADLRAAALPTPAWNPSKTPCGECRLPAGETCDVCGASQPAALSTPAPSRPEADGGA